MMRDSSQEQRDGKRLCKVTILQTTHPSAIFAPLYFRVSTQMLRDCYEIGSTRFFSNPLPLELIIAFSPHSTTF
jgi:hypothetical protein